MNLNERINGNSWIPLMVVACASFIVVLDTFFMNVSIFRIVVDLNTDVSTIQMIVSFYTLITAALILVGTKLQDIVGKMKLFLIGVALFGIGTFTAAISTSTIMFFVGWSAIEGVAGALMLPAIVSIMSGTYSGKKRTIALATLGMMAGLADIVAPFLGGVITTFLSWRFTFAFELIFILFILVMQHKIPDFKPTESKNDLDIAGAIISGIGLVLLEVYDNFQKLDTVDGQDSIVVNTADIIIQNAMASVMHALAIVLGVILILTLRIKNRNVKKVR